MCCFSLEFLFSPQSIPIDKAHQSLTIESLVDSTISELLVDNDLALSDVVVVSSRPSFIDKGSY
jgi:hypothetical protein